MSIGVDHSPLSGVQGRLLTKAAVRTIEDLWTAIAHALPKLTPEECASYFVAAGYDAV